MKDSRVGCAPASHGTLRRGEEGGVVVKRRLPDRSKDSWREAAMIMAKTPRPLLDGEAEVSIAGSWYDPEVSHG